MNNAFNAEQFAAANQAQLEALVELANSAFARAERLTELSLNTVRAVVEDGVNGTRSLAQVKQPQDLAQLQSTLAQPMLEKVVAYSRSVQELATEGQEEISRLVETKVAELNKAFEGAIDQAASQAPAGSESIFAAVKSALAAANNLYDNATKAAKQASEIAEANLAAATNATVKAMKIG